MKSSTIRLIIWSVFGVLVLAVFLVLFLCPSIFGEIDFGFPSFSTLHYDDAEKYTAGGGEVVGIVEELDIEWVSGDIGIEIYDGTAVVIEESANTTDEKLCVHWYNDGGTLKIRFAESGTHNMSNVVKDLTVKLPKKTLLDKLEIDAVSADMKLDGLFGKELELVTVSGKIEGVALSFDKIEVESVSGNVELALADACVPKAIDCDSVSGNVTLRLPSDAGFTAEIDSVSGDFRSNFATVAEGKNKFRAAGQGDTEISLDSVSGDLHVEMSSIYVTE